MTDQAGRYFMATGFAREFLTVARIAGLVFVVSGLVAMSWSLSAKDDPVMWICFSLTFIAMAYAIAPREDLLAQLLADRSSVSLGRFIIEPLLGAGLCLISLWIATAILGAYGIIEPSAGLTAATLVSALLGAVTGIYLAVTAFALRKK